MLARAIQAHHVTNPDIVSLLKRDSEVLARIQSAFQPLARLRNMKITCFFEELVTPGVGMVSK
jgi:hypothetical protein